MTSATGCAGTSDSLRSRKSLPFTVAARRRHMQGSPQRREEVSKPVTQCSNGVLSRYQTLFGLSNKIQ